MIVAIHADAGPAVGLGHVMRCTGLALALRRRGMLPVLLNAAGDALTAWFTRHALAELRCADNPEALIQAARRAGAALLVADSYRLDRLALRRAGGELKLAWFDDTAQAPLAADAIINGSPAARTLPYALPATVLALLGPAYQVVRPGLTARSRRGPVRRLLVTYGGADPWNVGPRLAALLPPDIVADFVVGPFADIPANLPAHAVPHKAPADMAPLIDRADLAVSAGGQTLFELAAAKLPTIAFGLGKDQGPTLEWLGRAGAIAFAGWADDTGLDQALRHHLDGLIKDEPARLLLAERAHALVDGQGADRIAAALSGLLA